MTQEKPELQPRDSMTEDLNTRRGLVIDLYFDLTVIMMDISPQLTLDEAMIGQIVMANDLAGTDAGCRSARPNRFWPDNTPTRTTARPLTGP